MIVRYSYVEQLSRWRDKKVIKVITGVRCSGKSTLLHQFAERLQAGESGFCCP
ncbi:MAG: hypothetical protein MJ048_04610 [Acidaminococcaceae bacterium]|nr:hypothetical protein [Acidaminococcaceae bacterium]